MSTFTFETQLNRFWEYLKSLYSPDLNELAPLRGYSDDHPFFSNTPDILHIPDVQSEELTSVLEQAPKDLGLTVPNSFVHEFLLLGRWVTPIRLPNGDIVALVGWRPNEGSRMKYITTPSPHFSKKYILFGAHNIPKLHQSLPDPSRPYTFLTEGIFDCLALQSAGIPAVSVMGKICSRYQQMQFKFLGRVISIPDKDAGDVIQYDKWGTSSYLSWDHTIPGKDMDDLISLLGFDLVPTLHSAAECHDYNIRVSLHS